MVDDHSPDGTGAIAQNLAERYPNLKVLHRKKKTGLGKAYIEGFRWVLQNPSYERIVQMDADFSHDPAYIAALCEATQTCDVSLGSRYVRGGSVVNWKVKRKLLSASANIFVRFWLGIRIKDCTSGFRCFRRCVLENIGVETIRSSGYFFQIEVLMRCWQAGYLCREIPIRFRERRQGKTKLGLQEIWEAVAGVFTARFEPIRGAWKR